MAREQGQHAGNQKATLGSSAGRWCGTALILCALTGCAALETIVAENRRDPRDRPWDPKPGESLIAQVPHWDRAAEKMCAGHLPKNQRKPYQTNRC